MTRITLVQLTDCHLFADPDASLRGIATWPRFTATLQALERLAPQFDLLIITGDVAHDEILATYQAVARELVPWSDRLRIVPGNHDNRSALWQAFPQACGRVDDRIAFVQRFEHWSVFGLDSHQPGQLSGRLGPAQLRWLDEQLAATAPQPAAIFLHHPPVDIGSAWLDRIGLEDRDELKSVLERHSHVRLVLTGHVHQQLTCKLGDACLLTTPAVGPHFRPRTKELEILPHAPSLRIIELDDDSGWSSQVLSVEPPTAMDT